ncbi:MAG: FKBP-type peptidyl-prolyl cis-trans isomerase [Microbacteriaceae bacterium]|nr:FKBP-type peptidyl-prolyl cis-trans isomerase [Microbacteriaceae bacterium]
MRLSKIAMTSAALTLVLAGCSAGDDSGYIADDCNYYYPGFEDLTVEGTLGGEIQVLNATGVAQNTAQKQRKEVITGNGDAIQDDSIVTISVSAWTDQGEGILPIESWTVNDTNRAQAAWLDNVLSCAQVGDRIVYTDASTQFFSEDALASIGMSTDEVLVLVADVMALVPEKVSGEVQDMPATFPEISNDTNGAPVVTLRDGVTLPAAGQVEVFTRIAGTGDHLVAASDFITVQYHGVNLVTGEVFDTSWDDMQPLMMSLSTLIEGFQDGMIGQSVGSQIVVKVPADLGYGAYVDGESSTGDILFVIDILASDS